MDKRSEISFLKAVDSGKVTSFPARFGTFQSSFLPFALLAALAFTLQASEKDPTENECKQFMVQGYKLLQDAEKVRWDGEKARHDSHFPEAVVCYDKALAMEEEALKSFKAAESCALPANRKHAVFFEGVAWAEQGQTILSYNQASAHLKRGAPHAFCSAVHEIERAKAMGMTPKNNSCLFLELGLAYIGSGDNARGVAALEQFLASGEGNDAQKKQASDLKDFAEKGIAKAKDTTPPPICGKHLTPAKTPTKEDKPAASANQTESQIVGSITTGVGYDGNVTKLGRDLPLPKGLAGKGAAFNEVALSLENDWFFYHKKGEDDLIDKLAASYGIIHDAYDEHSASNNLGQTGLINYCHVISPMSCLGLQIGDTYLRDDTKSLSNTLAPQASFTYLESHALASKISYTLGWNKYFTPSTSLTNPDGFTNRIALEQSFIAFQEYRIWWPSLTFTGRFGHEWTTTDGIIGDRERENPLLKAECVIFKAPNFCSFVRSVTFGSSYEYRHDEYCNANFPSLSAANRYRRQDNTHIADFVVNVKMWYDERTKSRLELVLDYQSTTDNSNVPAKAFDEPRFMASLKFNF